MTYDEVRPQIASGDLLAFANGRFVSRLIRSWTGGSYSHVGVAWRYRDRVFVLAAREGRGVGLDALSTQLPAYWLRTSLLWSDETERLALEGLGLPYSYLDCARVALACRRSIPMRFARSMRPRCFEPPAPSCRRHPIRPPRWWPS